MLLQLRPDKVCEPRREPLTKQEIVVRILPGTSEGEHNGAALFHIVLQPLFELLIHDHHGGDDHQLVPGQVGVRGNHIHGDVPLPKLAVELQRLAPIVHGVALRLHPPGRRAVVVEDQRRLPAQRGGEHILIGLYPGKQVLHLIKFAPGRVVRVQHTEAELLRPLVISPVAEKEQIGAAVGWAAHRADSPGLGEQLK